MKQQPGSNRISPGVIAAVSAAVIAVSGAVAWLTLQTPPAPTPTPPYSEKPLDKPAVPISQPAQIYFLQDTGTSFKLVPQTVNVKADQKNPNEFLKAAFQSLLTGPTEGSGSTTIPKGTEVLDVKVESDGIHVNLSQDFTTGGGAASMTGRVGQVLYTATSLNPNAKVFIEVNGEKLKTLGGEGLEVEQPLTREIFDKEYPL